MDYKLNRFQQCFQERPELRYRRDGAAFVWSVGAAECGTEADEVHVGIDAADDAALQAGMTNLHLGLFVEDVAVNLHHLGHDATKRPAVTSVCQW